MCARSEDAVLPSPTRGNLDMEWSNLDIACSEPKPATMMKRDLLRPPPVQVNSSWKKFNDAREKQFLSNPSEGSARDASKLEEKEVETGKQRRFSQPVLANPTLHMEEGLGQKACPGPTIRNYRLQLKRGLFS